MSTNRRRHTPPPPVTTPPGTTPPVPIQSRGSADAFASSIGVCTHFSTDDEAYVTAWSSVSKLLIASGIRHIRDGLTNDTAYQARLNTLGAAGVHAQLIGGIGETPAFISGYPALVPSMESYEGLNEPDLSGSVTWLTDTKTFQKTLFNAAAPTKLPVVGPSLTQDASFTSIGNLGAVQTFGNLHTYFNGHNPGTIGWEGTDMFGVNGSLAHDITMVRSISSVGQGLYVTETGYDENSSNAGYTSSAIKVRYLLRTVLIFWNAGILRTYIYELLDDENQQFGLLDSTGAPKSSYYAIKNLIAAYADPGAAFTLVPLACTIGSTSSTIQSMIAQKRNGSYILALWNEVPSWDVGTNVPIVIAPQTVTLSFTKAPTSIIASTFNDAGNLVATPVSSTHALAVTDNVTLVTITP